MFHKILIANRGVIARRITRTLKKLGIKTVAVYSAADADSLHVREADEAILLGPAAVAESYLRVDKILAAAEQTGASAIHPGYGFLSENAEFATACEAAGLAFIGPSPEQLRLFGLKHTARAIAEENGVPLLPGSGLVADLEEAALEAERIGYPVMLKSTAGGGGIGMRVCQSSSELSAAFESVVRLSKSNFQGAGLFLEKFVSSARHLEVQIFGDGQGGVLALGERDCSTQRRHQKVIEEAPAPGLSTGQRAKLFEAALKMGRSVNYRSAGTVEFVFDALSGAHYFLEVNTRLQVEHGVTEEVMKIDLVEWMVRLAAGERAFLRDFDPTPRGHSIQVRLYAEDPHKNFQPSCGLLTEVVFPRAVRCETWVEPGTEVTPFYDPMLAKVIVHAADRPAALAQLQTALAATAMGGIECNLDYLRKVIATPTFVAGLSTTRFLGEFAYAPRAVDVIEAGTQTTVQDYPGRIGFWAVGVPPSGPMDHLAHRLANRLLCNHENAATLELVMLGPTLCFQSATRVALCGADFQAELNGQPCPRWEAVAIQAGDTLRIRGIQGPGLRAYLAVQGGFQVPCYLGSRATFTLGKFGGHGGRALRAGDVLRLAEEIEEAAAPLKLPSALIPKYTHEWEIGVLYGPHGAPEFFTESDLAMFFSTAWKVHYNSNPTGVRLIGPKPQWARPDGGEAGLHPSNIHDNAYAIGAIDFTGDMPIILGPDGPSLGGFVCPACIVQSELWKMGQLKPGDTVRFHRVSLASANASEREQDAAIATLAGFVAEPVVKVLEDAIEGCSAPEDRGLAVCYRRAGDKYLLVEYGALVLDLALRLRVHALMEWLQQKQLPGIIDLTPGIRSLQIHYDSRRLPLAHLMETLQAAEGQLPLLEDSEVPSRIVHLPLSWDDPATQLAIQKYMQSVRADAPWCPSNLEFIRRINGLTSIDEVKEIVFQANYLVLGLGDVYLGAPVATPLDPRHRLVTTKYNPARTWTPENAVGIGGAYLCIYGMEGPGGYQFVGRTVQCWNSWRTTKNFEPGKPWLLRFFDQIKFYPVTAEELLQHRADFLHGRFEVKVEESTFRLREYQQFLSAEAEPIARFRQTQRTAFAAERERWEASGQSVVDAPPEIEAPRAEIELPPGGSIISAPLPGNVWQVLVQAGDRVSPGDKLLIVESMKMETAVVAPGAGTIERILCAQGRTIEAGQPLLVFLEG